MKLQEALKQSNQNMAARTTNRLWFYDDTSRSLLVQADDGDGNATLDAKGNFVYWEFTGQELADIVAEGTWDTLTDWESMNYDASDDIGDEPALLADLRTRICSVGGIVN